MWFAHSKLNLFHLRALVSFFTRAHIIIDDGYLKSIRCSGWSQHLSLIRPWWIQCERHLNAAQWKLPAAMWLWLPPSVLAGAAEAREAFAQLRVALLGTRPQHQQPDVWQQTVHSAGEWTGQTGQAATPVQEPSQVQTGSRDAALLDHFTTQYNPCLELRGHIRERVRKNRNYRPTSFKYVDKASYAVNHWSYFALFSEIMRIRYSQNYLNSRRLLTI